MKQKRKTGFPFLRFALFRQSSFSSSTEKPFFISSAAATPFPAVSFPVNVPSYTTPFPQDGLLDFNTQNATPFSFAAASAASAPAHVFRRDIRPVLGDHPVSHDLSGAAGAWAARP